MTWAFVTGEYPPQPGGVSDYTRAVANGLAALGDEVHVWAPRCHEPDVVEPGVTVHRLPGLYGPSALRQLDAELDRLPSSRRLFVQYVPHAFGWKAMNIPFCLWLQSRRRDSIWTMFHEVAFPLRWNQRAAEQILGAVTHGMARLVARTSQRIFYSTRGWLPLLDRFAASTEKAWLPVPSNLAETIERPQVAAVRERLTGGTDRPLIGHFGTYGAHLQSVLEPVVAGLLHAESRRVALLAGRGSRQFRESLLARHADLSGRIHAIEDACVVTLSAHLAACDLLLQPFPDGVTTRRTSLMAGLALGKAIVTNCGPLTEPLWRDSAAVALAAEMSPAAISGVAAELLTSIRKMAELGSRAADLYASTFALQHTLRTIRTV